MFKYIRESHKAFLPIAISTIPVSFVIFLVLSYLADGSIATFNMLVFLASETAIIVSLLLAFIRTEQDRQDKKVQPNGLQIPIRVVLVIVLFILAPVTTINIFTELKNTFYLLDNQLSDTWTFLKPWLALVIKVAEVKLVTPSLLAVIFLARRESKKK